MGEGRLWKLTRSACRVLRTTCSRSVRAEFYTVDGTWLATRGFNIGIAPSVLCTAPSETKRLLAEGNVGIVVHTFGSSVSAHRNDDQFNIQHSVLPGVQMLDIQPVPKTFVHSSRRTKAPPWSRAWLMRAFRGYRKGLRRVGVAAAACWFIDASDSCNSQHASKM